MKFVVQKEVFDKIEDLYIGVVVAKGVDNSKEYKDIDKMRAFAGAVRRAEV